MKHLLLLLTITTSLSAGGSQSKGADSWSNGPATSPWVQDSLNNTYERPQGREMTSYERDMYLFGKDYADEWQGKKKSSAQEEAENQRMSELYRHQCEQQQQQQLINDAFTITQLHEMQTNHNGQDFARMSNFSHRR